MSLQQGEDGVRSRNHVPKQAIFRAISPVSKHFGHLRRPGALHVDRARAAPKYRAGEVRRRRGSSGV